MKDMEWMKDAFCATYPDKNLWFPAVTGPAARRQARAAAELCRTQCPVMLQCRAYRDEFGYQFGVWGGRWGLEAKRVAASVIGPEHGSEAAYKTHLREGSEPCQRCRDGANLAKALREEKRRKRSA